MKSLTAIPHSLLRLMMAVILFHASIYSTAQSQSGLRISLLTCSPGKELYSTFGHSAIRLIDSSRSGDWVFNYGTFDFSDPDFYSKFVQGKLLYFVSIERTPDFIEQYRYEERKVVEQELSLNESEKMLLHQFLLENLKPENRFYQYDFFFDNCTTRLRDLLEKSKQPSPNLPAVMPVNTRFREAIHTYLNQGNQHWSKLGIDLLLGARTDRVMQISEQQFLPDNLMHAINRCTNQTLVSQTLVLYEPTNDQTEDIPVQPMHASLLLVGLLGALAWFEPKNKMVKISMVLLDGVLFIAAGLLGILLAYAWFGTDHIMTKENYNLLWALPGLCLIPFLGVPKKIAHKRFVQGHLLLLVLTLLVWFWLPQQLNVALIPMVAWMAIRLYQKAPLHATQV